jgi:hypothetical protein
MIADPTVSKLVASIASILSGAIITFGTILNPAKEEQRSETAGDRYRILGEYIEVNEARDNLKDLKNTMDYVQRQSEALTLDTQEPDPKQYDKVFTIIREQVKRCEQACQYETQSEGEESEIDVVIESPANTPTTIRRREVGQSSSLSVSMAHNV